MTLPWARFRHEFLILALVALGVLAVMQRHSTQDESRLALTQSIIERGTLNTDPYPTDDQSRYDGHLYTDKAPGLSFLAIPAVAAVRAADRVVDNPSGRAWEGAGRRYVLRLLINGPLLLGFALVVGRASEGLVPGTGAPAAAVAGIGTLAAPLSTVLFAHTGAALAGLGALLLAWRARYVAAGLCSGAAVLLEYPLGVVAVLLAVYVARRGIRPLLAYVACGVPAAVALGAYNWAAFGSPFNLSYQYLNNVYAKTYEQGFFAIGVPSLEDLRAVLLAGSGFSVAQGLLVTSPALLAAAAGLVLLWRRGLRAETLVCLAVVSFFLVTTAGNAFPFGGHSPGPRYFAPALGFLLLGLPEALRRWPRVTAGLGVLSIGVTTVNTLAWELNGRLSLRLGLPETIWSYAGLPRAVGVAFVFAAAAAAAVVAFGSGRFLRWVG